VSVSGDSSNRKSPGKALAQLENNLGAFEVSFGDNQLKQLDAVSAIDLASDTLLRGPFLQQVVL
jgi:hypothetical protein